MTSIRTSGGRSNWSTNKIIIISIGIITQFCIFLRRRDYANKITSKQTSKQEKGKRKIFLYFCKNVLEVGEMKMRGKWQIK